MTTHTDLVKNAYDQIDRYLRNNLDDSDYADYSAALEIVFRAEPAVQPEAQWDETKRFCNKCGYFGEKMIHNRANGTGECEYLSSRTKRVQPEAPAVPTDEQINAVFKKYAGVNDFNTPYLRTYEEGFRYIARAVLDLAAPRAEASPQPTQAGGEPKGWREALRFYADRSHFAIADEDAWDTVSGEPANFWCDEAGTATVEDGTVAAMALRGTPLEDEPTPSAAVSEYPPLPRKRRLFFCTKCGSKECQAGTEDQTHPPCGRCDYLGFADDCNYDDDEMRAYLDTDRAARESEAEDAARYQYLRSVAGWDGWNLLGHYTDEALDEKIDAARKAQGGK